MSNFYNNVWAAEMMASARSKVNGKPVANNTRLFDNGDGSYRLRLHNTDIITYNADGTWTLANGGWATVTTLQRIREYSPAHIISVSGEWYVWLERNPADPKPEYVAPAVPAPYERPVDFVQDGPYHDYYGEYHTQRKQRVYDECMERFGSVEQWREERKRQFAARKQYLADIAAWEDRNRIPFYDGITVNENGYAPKLRADGPSPAKLRKHEREVKRVKKAINTYVNGFIAALQGEGLPMPSGGDCWFCCMFDAVPSNDDGQRLAHRGTTVEPGDTSNNDHLWSHIEDEYYVPSLAVNALRERGYRDVGIYMWLDMNQDTGRMGKPNGRYDGVKRDITRYMSKRLIPNAPTE
jgi:hypothetical protein